MKQDTWQDNMTNRESHDRQEQGTKHKTHTVTGTFMQYLIFLTVVVIFWECLVQEMCYQDGVSIKTQGSSTQSIIIYCNR
jgi:hypothetical protein